MQGNSIHVIPGETIPIIGPGNKTRDPAERVCEARECAAHALRWILIIARPEEAPLARDDERTECRGMLASRPASAVTRERLDTGRDELDSHDGAVPVLQRAFGLEKIAGYLEAEL